MFLIRRLLPSVLHHGGRRPALVALVALLAAAVVVPIAASRSTPSPKQIYSDAVEADGGSVNRRLLTVEPRSILAREEPTATRSLEFWARPHGRRGPGDTRDRLSLAWGMTHVRFRARLAPRRFTHVVVEWGGDAIRLRFDGNLVDAVSMGAPSGAGEAHRVSVTGPMQPVDLRAVALYRRGLELRSVRGHYRAGAVLFGRPVPAATPRPAGVLAHAAAVPANTAVPAITGTAKDGQTLTSTNGTWSGSPTSYSRAWQRCDTAGANCVAISGATATTYLVTSADVGKTVRVKVTATNASGSGNATSAATSVVMATAPANTAVPTITGTAKDGQTLTSTTGTWTGTTPLSYARQWRRCDSSGANCADVAGESGTTYTLVAGDVGKTVRVVVTASNTAGNASATSTTTSTVTTAAPVNTALPTISGTAKEGQLLTASTGTWTGSATITYIYQWQTCTSAGASCTAISGATLSTYRLATTDVGKTVKVVVTAANGAGSAVATSAASAATTTGPPVNVAAPTSSGTASVGQTLTSANGAWAGTATISYARQWKRCNNLGAGCVAISGATGTTYSVVSADAGSTIRVTWTATNGVGSTTADTAATAVVTAPAPANTALPAITGTVKDGQTLTATTGTWSGSPTSYTRQWRRCNSAGGNCADIGGATATTYVLTSGDIGATVKVAVTATNSAGSASADSAATATVIGSAPGNTALPAIAGTTKDGQTLISTSGTWSGSSPITYTRQWQRCNSAGGSCVAIAGETASSYVLTATDVAKRIRVAVTATNAAGSATASSAATSTVTANAPANTSAPQIVGTAKENFYVYTTSGSWSGSGPFTYSYQWQQCDAAGTNCTNIDGRTFDGIDLTPDLLGLTVRVLVTASNSAGSSTTASAASAPVTSSAPAINRNPVVALDASTQPIGDTDPSIPIFGATFGQLEATWYGTQPISVTYQWQRCDDQGNDCADISGATAKRYKTTYADINKRLRIRVIATNSLGTATVTSEPGALITNGAPTMAAPPTLAGTPRSHFNLTADPGTWTGPLPYTSFYTWYRCDSAGQDCQPVTVDDELDPNYELTDADVGYRIRAHVNTRTAKGSGNADTDITSEVVAGSTPPSVTLGGGLVSSAQQWLNGDSYSLDLSVTAASDTNGLRSIAVMYDGEVLASYDGCSGAGCSVTHNLDVDTSEVADGESSLLVVATDADRTQISERRTIRLDHQAPLSPSHPLVDLDPDGTVTLTWQSGNSPDLGHYEILRRNSPEDPFAVIGTTQDESYVYQPSSTAPLARMSAARIALADDAPTGGEHVEYQIRAVDQAGAVSSASPTVEATATETPSPAPAALTVEQPVSDGSAEVTWDPAPGADRYAVYRTLDADQATLEDNGGTHKVRGAPELVADVPAAVTNIEDTPEIGGRYTYSVRPVSDTGQLGDTSPASTVDLQPTKVPPSQEVVDHARDIQGLLEDGGAPARERVPCTTKCKELRSAERALEKTGRSADKIVDQLAKLRAKIGSWPSLTKLGGAEAVLLEQDFELGWEIGTRLRKAYFTEKIPPATPEIHQRRLLHGGDVAATWACSPDYWGSACIGNGWTTIIGHMHAPSDQGMIAVGRTETGGQILYETWNDDCSTSELSPQLQQTLPGGWKWLTETGPCPFFWNATDQHSIPYQRVRLGDVVADPTDERSESGHRVDTDDPGLSEASALQALLDALQIHPNEYADLIAWVEHQLGTGDGSTPDGTPSCTGATYASCVTKFQHAGFQGPFSHVVLDPEEAWVGLPGGAVVDTTPYADDDPDEDGAVIIRTNPDPMPAWTAEDEEVDQHIRENHDTSPKRNEDLDNETVRKNAVRQCRIRVMKLNSGRTLSDCWTMPILITGGLDAHGPAVNDTEAVKDNPRWIGLNRRPSPYPSNDGWYFDQPGPADGCLQPSPPTESECHEFPFWSTQQHWARQPQNVGPLALGRPHISWTDRDENQRQGKVLQRFYGASNTDKFRFTGCEIPQTPDPPMPLDDVQRFAFPPTFLAIPVNMRLMPTFGVCNDGRIVP